MTNDQFSTWIVAARLFPAETVVQEARKWLEGEGWRFLELAPSQIGALREAVRGAANPGALAVALHDFLSRAAAHSKGRTPWQRTGDEPPLTKRLADAVEAIAGAVTTDEDEPANSAFKNACKALDETAAAAARAARELAIQKDFLDALLCFHQARAAYPFLEDYDSFKQEDTWQGSTPN